MSVSSYAATSSLMQGGTALATNVYDPPSISFSVHSHFSYFSHLAHTYFIRTVYRSVESILCRELSTRKALVDAVWSDEKTLMNVISFGPH